MKNTIKNLIIDEITKNLVRKLVETENITNEGTGFDSIFEELKKKLDKIEMLPDNAIDAGMYKEHEITNALKEIGYMYKKPMGAKLHFFNKNTSISVYVVQSSRKITLLP